MAGNAYKDSTSIALSGNVSLGNITLGSDGKVVVPVTQIASSVASSDTLSAATAFDFHGVWRAGAFTGTIPAGYTTVCAAGSQSCQGPTSGMQISLIRLAGKVFTPTTGHCTVTAGNLSGGCTVSDGTVGADDAYGISIWAGSADALPVGMGGGEAPLKACAYKVGVTADEVRAYGRIHLASAPTLNTHQLLLEAFTFSTPSGYGGDTCTGGAGNNGTKGCSQPWMKTGATATWGMQDCTNTTKTGTDSVDYNFFVCKSTATLTSAGTGYTSGTGKTVYFAHSEGGGCKDSNNKPIRVENWSGISPTGACTVGTHAVAGVSSGTCNYVAQVPVTGAAATSFSCTWTDGAFTTAAMTAPIDKGHITYSSVVYTDLITSGHACKTIDVTAGGAAGTAAELMRLRCYAAATQGGGGKNDCSQMYRFNWGASAVADFVMPGRQKPDAAFVTNVGQYSSDGNTFMVNDIQNETGSVFVNNMNVICNIEKSTSIVATKVTNSQLKIEIIEKGRVTDLSKDVCRAVSDCVGRLVKTATEANTTISETDIQNCSSSGDVAWRLKPSSMVFLMDKASN